jgi:hypothetical protein
MLKKILKELDESVDSLPITFYNMKAIKTTAKNFLSIKYKKNNLQNTSLHPIQQFYKPISKIPKNGN